MTTAVSPKEHFEGRTECPVCRRTVQIHLTHYEASKSREDGQMLVELKTHSR